jgi:hypothetical protein
MLAVVEPIGRFILLANCASFSNITAASGYFASRNLGPFTPRSSPETPHNLKRRITIQSRYAVRESVAR